MEVSFLLQIKSLDKGSFFLPLITQYHHAYKWYKKRVLWKTNFESEFQVFLRVFLAAMVEKFVAFWQFYK